MNIDEISFPEQLEPIKNKIFYKYKSVTNDNSFEYLLDSIENKYFYFSRPDQLNDPFDANVPNSYDATDEEIENWLNNHPRLKALSVSEVRNKINDGSLITVLDKAAEKDRNNCNGKPPAMPGRLEEFRQLQQ